jgi:hypothetical protein
MSNDKKIIPFSKLEDESEPNFLDFAGHVSKGDILKATRCLRDILQISYPSAERAVDNYMEEVNKDPNYIKKTMQIRLMITEGNNNDALLMVQEVFKLSGAESIKALDSIKNILFKMAQKNLQNK